jgi:hypothetical protein
MKTTKKSESAMISSLQIARVLDPLDAMLLISRNRCNVKPTLIYQN